MLSHSTNPTQKGQTHSYEGLLLYVFTTLKQHAFLYHLSYARIFFYAFLYSDFSIFSKNYRVQVALNRTLRTVLDATSNAKKS
jgi:hypothetical protein